jgi:lysozyme
MKTSKNGIDLIKKYEGCRLTAYVDSAGVWTIGYGHTQGVKQGDKITQDQADKALIGDLTESENCINAVCRKELTQNQFDALVSFVFNVGCGAFRSSTMLKYINLGKFTQAALEFPKWNKSVGKVLDGLTKRRESEQLLFVK